MRSVMFDVPGPMPEGAVREDTLRAMCWDGLIELDQLLRYAVPAHDAQWSAALTRLVGNDCEARTVTTLTGELSARLAGDPEATFDRPVTIAFIDPADWDQDDQADFGARPTRPHIANGMHRIAAAVIAGARWIRTSQGSADADDLFGGQMVGVVACMSAPALDADLLGVAFGWLRSFRLAGDVWVEADTFATVDGRLEADYFCPHDRAGDLAAALASRAAAGGVTLSVLGTTDAWDEPLASSL